MLFACIPSASFDEIQAPPLRSAPPRRLPCLCGWFVAASSFFCFFFFCVFALACSVCAPSFVLPTSHLVWLTATATAIATATASLCRSFSVSSSLCVRIYNARLDSVSPAALHYHASTNSSRSRSPSSVVCCPACASVSQSVRKLRQ